jgi:hypothetical protein
MARALAGCPWADDAELDSSDARGFAFWASGDGRRELVQTAFDAPLTSAQQLREAVVILARRAGV